MDPQSFLQAMYKEQCDQARQHETLRERSTAILISIASALITFASAAATYVFKWTEQEVGDRRVFAGYGIIGLLILGLGRFGRSLSLKHYERNQFHTERARVYREELEKLFAAAPYGRDLRDKAKDDHLTRWKKESPDPGGFIVNSHLYTYWMGIYRFIILFAVVLIIGPVVAAFYEYLVSLSTALLASVSEVRTFK